MSHPYAPRVKPGELVRFRVLGHDINNCVPFYSLDRDAGICAWVSARDVGLVIALYRGLPYPMLVVLSSDNALGCVYVENVSSIQR